MKRRAAIRIVTTNDFGGTVLPVNATFGRLPGLAGVTAAVDQALVKHRGVWIDGGDFAGGVLGELAGAAGSYGPAQHARIDAGVLGNHELDHGVHALHEHYEGLGFPLLCANADLRLPATAVLDCAGVAIGVVGVTHRQLNILAHEAPAPDWAGGSPIAEHARQLRRDGAEIVIVAVHDGVDWFVHDDMRVEFRSNRIAALLDGLDDVADAVIGGHTIGRWIGYLGSLPFAQPWPFGAEVGVIDIAADGTASVSAVRPTPVEQSSWKGPGGDALRAADARPIGYLDTALCNSPGAQRPLAQFAAEALVSATAAASAAIVPAQILLSQPPVDGIAAALPAGVVTELDLLRVVSSAYDRCVVADLSAEDLSLISARLRSEARPQSEADAPWTYLRMDPGVSARTVEGGTAVPEAWLGQFSEWLGRQVYVESIAGGLRDAMVAALDSKTAAA